VINIWNAGSYHIDEDPFNRNRPYSNTRRLSKLSITSTTGHTAQQYFSWVEDLIDGY